MRRAPAVLFPPMSKKNDSKYPVLFLRLPDVLSCHPRGSGETLPDTKSSHRTHFNVLLFCFTVVKIKGALLGEILVLCSTLLLLPSLVFLTGIEQCLTEHSCHSEREFAFMLFKNPSSTNCHRTYTLNLGVRFVYNDCYGHMYLYPYVCICLYSKINSYPFIILVFQANRSETDIKANITERNHLLTFGI